MCCARPCLTATSACPKADWAHLPSDVLAAIVLNQDVHAHKTMHLTCQQWTTAVRCNMHTMQPAELHTEQLRMYFPSVRHLFLHNISFQQNSTLCLATMRHLQTLQLQNCRFEAAESVAELAALSGSILRHSHQGTRHACVMAATLCCHIPL